MTSTTTMTPEAANQILKATEALVRDLATRFTETRDRLAKMAKEGDSRILQSSSHIAAKADLEDEVAELAKSLETARTDLVEAQQLHQEALQAAYEDALPAILDRRHELAEKADQLISDLNATLAKIMKLNGQEVASRDAARQGGSGILRQDKIVSGWVMSHIPALRSIRGPGSLVVYPMCRGDLAKIYGPYAEEEA